MTQPFPPHGDNEPLYYLGQADYWRGVHRQVRPTHWTERQWIAYQDGLHEAHCDASPDIAAMMNEQCLAAF